jgi:hypothetical protein
MAMISDRVAIRLVKKITEIKTNKGNKRLQIQGTNPR